VVAVAGGARDRVQRDLGAGPMACGGRRVEPLSHRQIHREIVGVPDAARLPCSTGVPGRPSA